MTKVKQKQRKLIAQKKNAMKKSPPIDKPIHPIVVDIVDTLLPEHQRLLKLGLKSNEGLIKALEKYKELKESGRR